MKKGNVLMFLSSLVFIVGVANLFNEDFQATPVFGIAFCMYGIGEIMNKLKL